MRLWSTVVIQLAKRPRHQGTGYCGYVSALTATGELLLHILDDGVALVRVPAAADRRHRVLAVGEKLDELCPLRERRVVLERWADQAATVEPVTRAAGSLVGLLAEAGAGRQLRRDPALEVRGLDDAD